ALPQYNELELDRLARRVGTDSAGIPLLAVELLHAVAMGLDLRETKGAWPEPFKTLDQTLPGELPDAVVAAIRIGFRRLTPEAQRALAVAAVVGGRVSRGTLGRGAGLRGEGLDAALDVLEWRLRVLLCGDSSHVVRLAVPPQESVSVTGAGAGGGEPVVLVPGLFGSAFGYRHLIPLLVGAGYQAIVFEPLGVGTSARPERADY